LQYFHLMLDMAVHSIFIAGNGDSLWLPLEPQNLVNYFITGNFSSDSFFQELKATEQLKERMQFYMIHNNKEKRQACKLRCLLNFHETAW
jgi:hypothetical protein